MNFGRHSVLFEDRVHNTNICRGHEFNLLDTFLLLCFTIAFVSSATHVFSFSLSLLFIALCECDADDYELWREMGTDMRPMNYYIFIYLHTGWLAGCRAHTTFKYIKQISVRCRENRFKVQLDNCNSN